MTGADILVIAIIVFSFSVLSIMGFLDWWWSGVGRRKIYYDGVYLQTTEGYRDKKGEKTLYLVQTYFNSREDESKFAKIYSNFCPYCETDRREFYKNQLKAEGKECEELEVNILSF